MPYQEKWSVSPVDHENYLKMVNSSKSSFVRLRVKQCSIIIVLTVDVTCKGHNYIIDLLQYNSVCHT